MAKKLLFAFLIVCMFVSCAPGAGDTPGTEPDNETPETQEEPGLAETVWQWQHRAFYFLTDTEMEYHRMSEFEGEPPAVIPYPYTYDRSKKQGKIEVRGAFRVLDGGDSMYFPNYTSYGHAATFKRVEKAVWPE